MRNQAAIDPDKGLVRSVHITNCYHKSSGGISTSYNNLLTAATKRGRHIALIVPGETESVEEVSEFAKIYYVPAKKSPVFDKRYRVMMPWQYLKSDSIIRKILLKEKPNMIEVTDKYTLSMLGPMIRSGNFSKLGRPMMVHFSCERMDDNIQSFIGAGRFGKWFSDLVMRNYHLPAFDFHLANSHYTAEEFFESLSSYRGTKWLMNKCWNLLRSPRLPIDERIHVCPRGVNIEQFNNVGRSEKVRGKIRADHGIPADTVLLLYAGRLSPEKNVDLLLDLMKELYRDKSRDIRLLVAGDGPKSDWLQKMAEKHIPGKMIFLGHLDKEPLADLYANADVFIHPNPREPFGIAPLEAMASGIPVVAPNSGGILSYASQENTWLVDPTAKAFAGAVQEVLDDETRRNEKLRNAELVVKENTSEISANRLLDTYDAIYQKFLKHKELFTETSERSRFNFIEFARLLVVVFLISGVDLDDLF